ncbi:MAG: hypothetical protein K6G51_03815 [Sphaerochaetaceae bacterium]|nr:hypothetical protein [Sphaerochaetaceae bacterium]
MKDDRGSYNKRDLAKLNWTTGLEYQTIWFMFCKTFASLTDNAELVSYNSLNHQYIKQDYASFLLANDGDLFVKTYPTMNAFIISSEGTEFCYVTDGDGSGLGYVVLQAVAILLDVATGTTLSLTTGLLFLIIHMR